jgi:hypothetical protein
VVSFFLFWCVLKKQHLEVAGESIFNVCHLSGLLLFFSKEINCVEPLQPSCLVQHMTSMIPFGWQD